MYTVNEVKGKDPLGLRVYFLVDKHGMDVKTADGKRKLFKGSELLKVFPNKDGVFEEYLTQQQVNKYLLKFQSLQGKWSLMLPVLVAIQTHQ